MLQGFLIPIINTTYIELSTTAYLTISFSPRLILRPNLLHLHSKSNQSKTVPSLSPQTMQITPLHRTTTLPTTPSMVMQKCSNISAPGNRYSRVRKNVKPLGRCELNSALPNWSEGCRNVRQLVAVRTQIVSICVQDSRHTMRGHEGG